MKPFLYTAVAVALFFGFALYSVAREERRRLDRRQNQRLAPTLDQRRSERRSGHPLTYLAWVLRAMGSRFRR